MTFKLRVPGDGDGHESISSCQYSDYKMPSWNKDEIRIMQPKEFTITPSSGTIRPQGFAAIRVKCTAFQHIWARSQTLKYVLGPQLRCALHAHHQWETVTLIHVGKWAFKAVNYRGQRNQIQIYWAKRTDTALVDFHQSRYTALTRTMDSSDL